MNPIDEYEKSGPARDQRRMTVHWKADGRNVLTDDGPEEKALHIATFASPAVAAHIVELHNRTMGDGQEPATAEEATRRLAEGLRLPRELLGQSPPLSRYMARRHPTSRTLVHIDVLQGVAETVQRLVNERVAEYAAREPARIVIDGNPTAMANMLTKLGYTVFAPDFVFEVPPDWLLQINAMRANLGQDIAEMVPGASQAVDWLDRTQLDAEKPVDNVRRAFLAGYAEAARISAEGDNP
jgi:hypothetical protein